MTEMEFIVEVAQPEHEKYAEAICNEMRESGIALSAGLKTNGVYAKSKGDYTHFTAEAQLELGERYFCAFARLKFPKSESAQSAQCLRNSIVN